MDATGKPIDSGSGFVITSSATSSMVVTSNHVISAAKVVSIDFDRDVHDLRATVIARDKTWDLALVRIERGHLKAITFAPKSRELVEGITLAAAGYSKKDDQIGFTGQEPHLLYPATISSLGRENKIVELANVRLEPGTSGGPVFDPATGAILGVIERSHAEESGGYAVSESVVLSFLAGHRVATTTAQDAAPIRTAVPTPVPTPRPTRPATIVATHGAPYIGVAMDDIDDNVRNQLRYGGNGIVVRAVYPGAPFDQAGVLVGEVLQAVDGRPVYSVAQWLELIRTTAPGQSLRLGLWSPAGSRAVTVVVGTAPPR